MVTYIKANHGVPSKNSLEEHRKALICGDFDKSVITDPVWYKKTTFFLWDDVTVIDKYTIRKFKKKCGSIYVKPQLYTKQAQFRYKEYMGTGNTQRFKKKRKIDNP